MLLFLFVFLFHFFFVFGFYTLRLLRLDFLVVLRQVNLVRCEHFLVRFGILQQVFHYTDEMFGFVCRYAVETEAVGFLALPDKVLEEVIQHIATTVKDQEVFRILRFGGYAFRIAVLVESGHYTDFTRLLVTDNQHVLFFLFLFHCLKFVIWLVYEGRFRKTLHLLF